MHLAWKDPSWHFPEPRQRHCGQVEQPSPELRILTAKSMRRSSRLNSLFSFVTRHSLIVIRLLLRRQLKLPVLQKELSGHGTSSHRYCLCKYLDHHGYGHKGSEGTAKICKNNHQQNPGDLVFPKSPDG